ncbi:DUF2162 family putative transporter [Desulfatirhabdium butyrativorans]|uniref:DUF2162 family putative transporter n=1 Tax=Desulfatirhabdium butyrativorans TaxID=340467 RepID=UPI0004265F6D|nr:DUF2162 family putative transporter [Desulfatirhabdium butyrativorans]
MEWKTLILGIGMSMGVFGIKAGAGLYGGLQGGWANGHGRTIYVFVAAAYALMFGLLAAGLHAVHLMEHIDAWMRWLQAGMFAHVGLAVFLLIWGLMLKRSNPCRSVHRNGWWLLALPCPVCMTVIGISLAFLMALFPGATLKSVGLLYAGFMAVVLTTVCVLSRWAKRFSRRPEEILADAMMVLSVYFLLSVLIMPQFAGVEEVSRMGERSLQTASMGDRLQWLFMGLVVAAVFVAGYTQARRRRLAACWRLTDCLRSRQTGISIETKVMDSQKVATYQFPSNVGLPAGGRVVFCEAAETCLKQPEITPKA